MESPKRLIKRIFKILYSPDTYIRLKNIRKPDIAQFSSESGVNNIWISPWPSTNTALDDAPQSPAASLVHEAIHILKPDWSEKEVMRTTYFIWIQLSPKQKLALYELIFEESPE